MDGLFSFLFKFRPVLFAEGDLAFRTPWPLALVLGGVVGVGLVAALTYRAVGGKASRADRILLTGLRVATVALVGAALLQPTLVLSSVVPQRNFVGVLLDDSRSMELPGDDGRPRRAWVDATFGPEGSDLVEALGERFALRFYRFSSASGRIEHAGELGYQGTATDIAGALERVRQDLSSVPLSGLVLVSDGAETTGTPLSEALVPLQAASVPVYTVGVGAETLRPDVQVSRVEVPATVLKGTGALVDVVVTHRGLAGRSVELIVEDGGRIVAQESVALGGDEEPSVVRVPMTLDEAGPRRLRFRIPVQEGEAVAENNVRERLVEVRDAREKVLYFEGEPRWEVKFLRRAVDQDPNLQLVVLQRTAEDKFLRLAVDGPDELLGGFPRTREELFRYRALILGSVEASYFTRDQLDMISDFVGERGGGLLVLGGRNSLAEGGYAGTALEEVLPVYLEEAAPDPRAAFTEVAVAPTPAGTNHPVGRIGEAGWESLPPLSTLNRIERAKPGATVLLSGAAPDGDRIVLAHQRYGRGKSLVLPVQDTWMWQMHADVPVDDQRHETLWRQLLRWLVDDVPQPVSVALDRERSEAGEGVEIRATVLDSTYIERNDARVVAVVTDPVGAADTLLLPWTVDTDGIYVARFVPDEPGVHTVEVGAEQDGASLGTASTLLTVGPSAAEYFDAGLRSPLLQRLAQETGGRYYTPRSVDALAEDLQFTGAGVTLVEERDLWDMPVVFLLLVSLLAAEWTLRRKRGLV